VAGSYQRVIPTLQRAADRCWGPAYLVVFAGVLIFQLFVPPCVGLADNADSVRVTHGSVVPNYPVEERYFRYFTPEYLKADRPPPKVAVPFWTGRVTFLVAQWLGSLKEPGSFDIRWLGFVHFWIYLFCFSLFLFTLRRRSSVVRWIVPAAAIWIFGDVFYAAYLNSLYLDAMGFLCFLLLVVCLLPISDGKPPVWALCCFGIAALGLAASKPLNAPTVVLAGIFLALLSLAQEHGRMRQILITVGAGVTMIGILFIVRTPRWYGAPCLVDVVMMRIAKGPDAAQAIGEFGLLPVDLRFAGQDAFRIDGPSSDPAFHSRFTHNNAGDLFRSYLRHPGRALNFLREDMLRSAPRLRPLGDTERLYSPSAGVSRTRSFCSWSDLHASVLSHWPTLVLVLYGIALLSAFRGLYLPVLIALIGIFQFCSASLFDAIETARHLFMFHVATDVLVLMFVAWGLQFLSPGRKSPGRSVSLATTAARRPAGDAVAMRPPTSVQTDVDLS
jgi:hypothetical protein